MRHADNNGFNYNTYLETAEQNQQFVRMGGEKKFKVVGFFSGNVFLTISGTTERKTSWRWERSFQFW